MLRKNKGHVVSIASGAGLIGVNGLCDYCASKFAAVGFDESLRSELSAQKKTDVFTTVVCPSFIDTGMFSGTKTKLAEDFIAFHFIFLCLHFEKANLFYFFCRTTCLIMYHSLIYTVCEQSILSQNVI